MTKLLLIGRSINESDLRGLADALSGESVEVQVVQPARSQRYGVSWWESVVIYLGQQGADAVFGSALELLAGAALERARAWYKSRKGKGTARPLAITLRDSAGRAVRELHFNPDGEEKEVPVASKCVEPPPNIRPDGSPLPIRPSEMEVRSSVLFADISSSTALLVETAEGEFHDWLKRCRSKWTQVVEQHVGFVFHAERDNIEAYFTDENEGTTGAERAVAAALSIIDATKGASTHQCLRLAKTRVGVGTGILVPANLVA